MVAYPSVHRHDERPEPSIGIPSALIHDDRQRRERRFEAMRKVGDVASSPFEIKRILVEKRIELGDKGGDLAWLRAGNSLRSPCADALQVLGQLRQRSQPKPDLKQDAPHKSEREDNKRQRDRGHGFTQGTFERVSGSRGGNKNASVLETEALSANAQRLVPWTCSVSRYGFWTIFGKWTHKTEIVGPKRGRS
jgi:hypothetical protein